MNAEITKKKNIYKVFNDIVLENQILIFGSSFTANFPFYELSKKYLLSSAIYNRSIDNLTIADAIEILDDCVLNAKPVKIFYCFSNDDTNINLYRKLIEKTKIALPESDIYIMSSPDADCSENEIQQLSHGNHTYFLNINYTKSFETIFKQLAPFFRSDKISFAEAFSIS